MKAIRLAQIVLLVVGLAALGYCLAVLWRPTVFRQIRRGVSRVNCAATPPRPRPRRRLRLKAQCSRRSRFPRWPFRDGGGRRADSSVSPRRRPHPPGTALPGQNGNVAIAGHRDTFFRPLRRLPSGDTIVLRTLAGVHHYRVVSAGVVRPADIAVLQPTRRDALTLVTCFPFDYIGAAPARFVGAGGAAAGDDGWHSPRSLPPLQNRLGAAGAGERGAEIRAAYRP